MDDQQYLAELNRRCEQHMGNIADSLDEIKSAVFGNGKEGLMTRATKLEMHVEAINASRNEFRRIFYGIVAGLITTLIIAAASQFLAYSRAQAVASESQKMLREIKADIGAVAQETLQ